MIEWFSNWLTAYARKHYDSSIKTDLWMASRGITVQRSWRVSFGFTWLFLMAIGSWSNIDYLPLPLPVAIRATLAWQLNVVLIPLAFFFLLRSRCYAHVWAATGLVTLCATLWGCNGRIPDNCGL